MINSKPWKTGELMYTFNIYRPDSISILKIKNYIIIVSLDMIYIILEQNTNKTHYFCVFDKHMSFNALSK